MAENDNFVIVEFSDGLSIVPSTWLHEDRNIRWWPGHLKSQLLINGAIINRTRPEERTWVKYTVRKIFGTTDSYVKAMDKLIQVEDNSHIHDSKSINDTDN
ncbi:hypothetical protein PV325_005172 [Microctonus aethiopoides]|nr:hypothetical protein PV325_005172 [Microctonus aethiopoides]